MMAAKPLPRDRGTLEGLRDELRRVVEHGRPLLAWLATIRTLKGLPAEQRRLMMTSDPGLAALPGRVQAGLRDWPPLILAGDYMTPAPLPRGPGLDGVQRFVEAHLAPVEALLAEVVDAIEAADGPAGTQGDAPSPADALVCSQSEIAVVLGRSPNTSGLVATLRDRGEFTYCEQLSARRWRVRFRDDRRQERLRETVEAT